MAKKSKEKKQKKTAEEIAVVENITVTETSTELVAELDAPLETETVENFNQLETALEVAATAQENSTEEAIGNDSGSNKITDINEIESVLEGLIFASPKALTFARIKQILTHNQYDCSGLKDVLASLQATYENKGIQLVKVAGGYQFRTHPKHANLLGKLLEDKPARLSSSALEVLAIIAYKQPITRAEIDAIRGIDSGHLLKGLLEKNMVRTEGHSETPGRPLLYGTTSYFLEVFTLTSLDDLPAIEEFERELQQAAGVDGDENSADPAVLAADPDFFDRDSPLAANPDRGDFDQPSETAEEAPDFGMAEHVQEDLKAEEAQA